MKEAVKARGIDVGVTGAMANVLLQYAELLTSQGYLKEAYSYLGESQEVNYPSRVPKIQELSNYLKIILQESIQMLKDRLMYSLGLKTLRPEIPQGKSSAYFQTQQPHQVCFCNICPV